jgi:hypothetical protein
VDITVYLPDDLGQRAKEANLPFSRMLRDAVHDELDRRGAVENTLAKGIVEYEVELGDRTGVITGKHLGDVGFAQVFLTDDGRVLVHHMDREKVDELEDPETELADWLQNDQRHSDALSHIMTQLGFRPRVRL